MTCRLRLTTLNGFYFKRFPTSRTVAKCRILGALVTSDVMKLLAGFWSSNFADALATEATLNCSPLTTSIVAPVIRWERDSPNVFWLR